MERNHRIIIPDLLGFGQSPKPRADYSLADHTNALAVFLRSKNIAPHSAIVIGHSFGSILALSILAREPQWFRASVVLSLPIFKNRNEAISSLGKISLMHRGMLIGSRFAEMSCYLRSLYRIPMLAPLFGLPRDVYMDSMLHTKASEFGTLNHAIVEARLELIAAKIEKPVLFLHGDHDEVALIDNARDFSRQVQNGKFQVLDNKDHNAFLQDPGAFWREVQQFEASLPKAH